MVESKFPCDRIPEEPSAAKLVGLYRQRQEGLWLQRVRIPGGMLSSQQWHGLAAIARESTPRTPLHLTTRQDVEIHDLQAGQVPLAQDALAEVGMTCFAAAGDTVRNITVCPCSGIAAGSVDLHPLARQMGEVIGTVDGVYSLPRKFKIGLACGEDCGQPWINDLGFVARPQDGRWGFRVAIAGSLGPQPGTGMLLFDWLPAADALPLAAATIRVFAAHGDRTNRGKARLRHVRERMGDEAFSRLIREAFAAAKAERNWPDVTLTEPSAPLNARAVLTFANGDVTPAMADELGDLAADERLRVRIANQHRVVVFGQDFEVLAGALRNGKTLSAAARPQPSVVACPGKRWCSRALVHTNRVADRIRAELGDKLPPQMTVCISGCPNGCSHSAVANIGLSGVMASQGGAVAEAFNLYVGGGMGRTNALARLVASRLSPEEVLGCIERVLAASGASSVEREEN